MAEILVERLTKEFSGRVLAVDDVTLKIEDGEFMVLVGPSGCGKSTLLRTIAGLEEATAGTIWIGGRDVTDLPPREHDVAMVFQSYALYPHMTVRQNLGYGLKVRKTSKDEISKRVERVARLLRLEELLDRRPAALSGGQRQRVAMGRAIVREPLAFLMDEPLSNLDAKLRVSMRAELSSLHARLGATTVYVTHDQVEAMTLGQRVAVMRDGKIQQVDTPQALYRDPVNLFVAAFIGSPAMNLVEAQLEGDAVEFGGHRIPLQPGQRPDAKGAVVLGIRPESFEDAAFADASLPQLDAEVAVVEDLGSDAHVIFPVDAPRIEAEELRRADEEEALIVGDGSVFTARVDARTRCPGRRAAPPVGRPGRLLLVRPGHRREPAPPRRLGRRRARPPLGQAFLEVRGEARQRERDHEEEDHHARKISKAWISPIPIGSETTDARSATWPPAGLDAADHLGERRVLDDVDEQADEAAAAAGAAPAAGSRRRGGRSSRSRAPPRPRAARAGSTGPHRAWPRRPARCPRGRARSPRRSAASNLSAGEISGRPK